MNVKYAPGSGIVPGGQSGHHFLLLSILKIVRQSESVKNYSYPLSKISIYCPSEMNLYCIYFLIFVVMLLHMFNGLWCNTSNVFLIH